MKRNKINKLLVERVNEFKLGIEVTWYDGSKASYKPNYTGELISTYGAKRKLLNGSYHTEKGLLDGLHEALIKNAIVEIAIKKEDHSEVLKNVNGCIVKRNLTTK